MKTNKFAYLFLIAGLLSPLTSQAFCIFKCPPKVENNPDEVLHINPSETPEQARMAQDLLLQLQTEMRSRFESIELAMRNGDTKTALRESKEILDQVRIKIGIDPKVKMRESFYVNNQFPTDAEAFSDLNESQQISVITTIRNFRGGLFMDLMNLSKRVSLIYSRAFKAELKKDGGLNEEDRNKIIKDLVTASLVPMPVVDKNNKKIIVFDEDVANEDHTYLFNRELKMALLVDKDLAISEDSFNNYKQSVRASLTPKKKAKESSFSRAQECMNLAAKVHYTDDRNSAQKTCFYRHYSQLENSNNCLAIASQIYYTDDRNSAQIRCFNHFGK